MGHLIKSGSMEVVGARKNGAREGHIPEKWVPLPSRVSLACSALPAITSKRLLLRLKIRQFNIGKNSLLKISV